MIQNWPKQVWKTALGQIKHAVSVLEDQPYAGAVCQDLAALGISDYRQMLTSKNRIIYAVDVANTRIMIHILCDQKRDLQTLLMHRLINASLH
ncbi:MAG: type II toxin-antitoxin system RelE/ParE family toxin [Glaciimonas sp.]|nr:type II toxin-antitoxin system RelE/ParE family toxin [Glaciimonas sp.]